MAPSRTSHFLLAFLTLVPSSWAAFECDNVVAKGQRFDLKKLGGPHTVHWTNEDWSNERADKYNFTLDICAPLKWKKGGSLLTECHPGTAVCGIRETIDLSGQNNTSTIVPITIAGTSSRNGRKLEPKFTLLRETGSNKDASRQGVRAELHGGRLPFDDSKNGIDQRAIIEFVCDKEKEGTEGDEKDDGDYEDAPSDDDGGDKKDGDKKDGDKKEERALNRRDEPGQGTCEKTDRPLKFCGYADEEVDKKKVKTLRLEWNTKYACEDAPRDEGSHWGFFTWFIIIFFLATATYLIFGSWLNYNRYGARGWDLLPHGDTIRDIPYIVKDLGRKVVSTVQTPGSRGGYSAV